MVVIFNVAGETVTTRGSTLQRFAEEGHSLAQFVDGDRPFIDRDPSLFRHVLNYLRKGKIRLHETTDVTFLLDLRDEASFFGLQSLVCSISSFLGDQLSVPTTPAAASPKTEHEGLQLINDDPTPPTVREIDLGLPAFSQSADF